MKTFQSNWGHHPVNQEDFLILRKIHKIYWESLQQAYIWMRWQEKAEHNRSGPEPKTNKLFIDTDKTWFFYTKTKNNGCRGHQCSFKPMFLDIVADFSAARSPVQDVSEVTAVDMSKYRELYLKLTGATVPIK